MGDGFLGGNFFFLGWMEVDGMEWNGLEEGVEVCTVGFAFFSLYLGIYSGKGLDELGCLSSIN